MTQSPQKPRSAARTNPADRKRIEDGNKLVRLVKGEVEPKRELSYYSPILIQCTLPHSDPKVRDWKKTNGDFTLIVSSGVNSNLEPYGIPYGAFPRLVFAHVITHVIESESRYIELTSRFGKFLEEVGYTGNLRGNSRQAKHIKAQMYRLLNASIKCEGAEGTEVKGYYEAEKMDISRKFGLWWDFKAPEQDSLFGSWIELTEEFYNAILKAPVPLRTDVLAKLRKSPLALDVYMWVSYRLFAMQQSGQEQISLSYSRLQIQFGTGIAEKHYNQFRHELKRAFKKVAAEWILPGSILSQLNYEFAEDELILYRSPLLVGPAKPKAATESDRILTARSFDAETRKKARMIAGTWSVDYLQEQYFKWIADENITPSDASAHFLGFIKSHRQRNGEKV